MRCGLDCPGCSCHVGNAPCSHCENDHDNVDNHPECDNCDEILYDATENEIRWHKLECIKLE